MDGGNTLRVIESLIRGKAVVHAEKAGEGLGGGGGVGGRKRKRNLGKSTFKEVSKPFYCFEEIKPVKYTRDSNWLARYDFLVIRGVSC